MQPNNKLCLKKDIRVKSVNISLFENKTSFQHHLSVFNQINLWTIGETSQCSGNCYRERERKKMLRHQWRLTKFDLIMFLHLFVNLSIISFHSVIFVFATRLKSRDIKRAWSSKVKRCKNETDSMGNRQLNNADFYLVIWSVITWKWL